MKNKIHRILRIGLTAGLLFGLVGAAFADLVAADEMKWGIVDTPSWEGLVILAASDILDYDIGGDGDPIYAVLELQGDCTEVVWDYEDPVHLKHSFSPVTAGLPVDYQTPRSDSISKQRIAQFLGVTSNLEVMRKLFSQCLGWLCCKLRNIGKGSYYPNILA